MMDKLFDGSDAHLLPGNAELIEPPHEIICYALKVGDWFKERDITHWKIADCASRNALESADKRIAGLEEAASFNFEQYQDAAFRLCEANQRLEEERETYDRMLEEGANKLQELERKLAVAQEALGVATTYSMLEIDRKIIVEALAQIGGDDAGN